MHIYRACIQNIYSYKSIKKATCSVSQGSIPRYLLKRNENICLQKTCARLFIPIFFLIALNQMQPSCPSIT